jgi:hypothetical protein
MTCKTSSKEEGDGERYVYCQVLNPFIIGSQTCFYGLPLSRRIQHSIFVWMTTRKKSENGDSNTGSCITDIDLSTYSSSAMVILFILAT